MFYCWLSYIPTIVKNIFLSLNNSNNIDNSRNNNRNNNNNNIYFFRRKNRKVKIEIKKYNEILESTDGQKNRTDKIN